MTNRLILFTILQFVIPASPIANESDVISNHIFNLIYNQQYEDAEKILAASGKKIDNLNFQILNLDLLWWKGISENKAEVFYQLEKKINDFSKALEKSTNLRQLNELVYLNYLFRLASLKHQPLKKIHYFLKINFILEHMDKNDLASGYAEIFDLYKSVFYYGKNRLIFLNPKVREESMKTLARLTYSLNPVNQTLAIYFLAKIYNELEDSPELAKPYYERLHKLYPNNKIFENDLLLINKKNRYQ